MGKRDKRDGIYSSRLIEQAAVLLACLHRVDDRFGAVVPDENNDFEQSQRAVEPEAQFSLRVIFVEWSLKNTA